MTTVELNDLLNQIKYGDKAEVKLARQQILRELKYKRVKNIDALTDTYLKLVNSYESIQPAYRLAAFLSLLGAFGWHIKPGKKLDLAIDFAFYGMTHTDGTVRESARKGADWLRMTYSFDQTSTDQNFKLYLDKLEQLIEAHRPPQYPKYLDDMKPSIFKTLVLHWHELGQGAFGAKFVNQSRANELSLPTYTYLDEVWLDENLLSEERIAAEIWLDQGVTDFQPVEQALQVIASGASKRLAMSLGAVGLKKDTLQQITQQIARSGSQGGLNAFLQIVQSKAGSLQNRQNLNELAGVVRGIQSLANHYVRQNNIKQPLTDFIISCAMSKAEYGRHLPNSWSDFIILLGDAHGDIDGFHQLRSREIAELYSQLAEKYPDITAPEESDDEFTLLDIAHYALDCAAMSQPWILTRRNSRQLAALAWFAVRKANNPVNFNLDDLAKFGKWKTAGSVSGAGSSFYYGFVHQMADPELLNSEGKSPIPKLNVW